MKLYAFLAMFFIGYFGFVTEGKGQVDNLSLSNNVKTQASKMGQAFVAGDYANFASYTYPELVRIMGGKARMADALTKLSADMKSRGMTFLSITFGDISTVFKVGTELQCTLPQHTEIKTPDGRAISTSTLIAISTDGGKAWTFVDTSNKDISTIRKVLPHLSNAIVIPPQSAPVQYSY